MNRNLPILVVDNDQLRLKTAGLILQESGFPVMACSNIADAIEAVRLNRVAMVVTDSRLPGISGLEFIAMVHKHDQDLPVILISDAAEIDTALAAISLGTFDFLIKPYLPGQLIQVVKKALRYCRLTPISPGPQPSPAAARNAGTGAVPGPDAAGRKSLSPGRAPCAWNSTTLCPAETLQSVVRLWYNGTDLHRKRRPNRNETF